MNDELEKPLQPRPSQPSQRTGLKDIPLREELLPRTVKAPDGQEFVVEPLQDYYCQAGPRYRHRLHQDYRGPVQLGTRRVAVDSRLRHRLRRDRDAPADDSPLRCLPLRHPVAAYSTPGQPVRDFRLPVGQDTEARHPLLRADAKPQVRGRPGFLHHQRWHVLGFIQHHQAAR